MSSEDNLIQNEHYKKTLKQIIDNQSQQSKSKQGKYGPFVIILIARVVEKISHEELIATFTLNLAYTQSANIPLVGTNFMLQCGGYAVMALLVIIIHFIMSKASLSTHPVPLLVFAYALSISGSLIQGNFF